MAGVDVHEVSNLRCTATHIEIGTLVPRCILENFLIPIYVRIHVRVKSTHRAVDFVFRIKQIARPLVCHRLVIHAHKGNAVYGFGYVDGCVYPAFYTHADNRTVEVGTRFGLDNEHSVGATRTIHGRCCGVFENRETLNNFRVDGVKVVLSYFHAVHHDEWRGCTIHGRHATHKEVGTIVSWFAAALIGDNTRQPTSKGGGKACCRHFQVVGPNGLDRTRNRFLLLGSSESSDNGTFEHLSLV